MERQDKLEMFGLAIFARLLLNSIHALSTSHRALSVTRREPYEVLHVVSSCTKVTSPAAPRQADASSASFLLAAALLARQLSVVVVVVFEVARGGGGRRTAAGTLAPRLVLLHRLTAIILYITHRRTHVFNPPFISVIQLPTEVLF